YLFIYSGIVIYFCKKGDVVDERIKLLGIRALFIIVCVGIGLFLSTYGQAETDSIFTADSLWYMLGAVVTALILIIVEMFFSGSDISTVSSIVFGLIIGFIMASLFKGVVFLMVEDAKSFVELKTPIQLILTVIFCYLGVMFLMRTRHDFRFIIPYVEFRKDVRTGRPLILDTSAIIDGRIIDIMNTKLVESEIITPNFVIEELHVLSDSRDKIKRNRGKRGLDILNEIKRSKNIDLKIDNEDFQEPDVDTKLVALAASKNGKIITTDSNLERLAQIRNVTIVNLHRLADSLHQVILVGEDFNVRLVKSGENPGQGVGYLADGTMVVIDSGRDYIGQEIIATVTSTHQTTAGRMIFGKVKSAESQ
ncbi:MAG: PIN/TRAM domain-containing protein, partial [Planctomycetota bacterium]